MKERFGHRRIQKEEEKKEIQEFENRKKRQIKNWQGKPAERSGKKRKKVR